MYDSIGVQVGLNVITPFNFYVYGFQFGLGLYISLKYLFFYWATEW